MRKYLLFAVVATPVLLGTIGSTSVAVAFPTMVSHFDTSLVQAGWVLSVYLLTIIAAIPITSRLSDSLGRRSTFMLCLLTFIVGSSLCAVAPNMGWLIFFRVIQAAGGGGFISAASGIISDQVPDMRHQLIGLIASIANVGSIIGPNVGSVMVQSLGWQSVFWLNVPVGVVCLVLCKYVVKADVKKTSHGELDFLGVGFLVGFVSAIMISVTLMGGSYRVPAIAIILIALLGFLFLVMFYYRCKHSPGAVVSAELLTRRPFIASNLYNFAYGSCAGTGIMSLMPLYGASVYGMSVFESGLMITPRSFGVVVASIVASFYILKWGYRRPIVLGTLAISLGLAALALEPGQMTLAGINLTPVILAMIFALVVGIGSGIVAPASNNACIELMPDKVASITGLRQVARYMGGSIGIAVSTLVLQSSANIARGFTVVFMSFSIIMLLSIPVAFYMPKSPKPQSER